MTIVNGRFRVAKVNIDDEPALMQRFGVRAVPTLLFFSGGEMRDQIVGGAPKKTIFEKLAPLAKARHSSTKAKTSRDPSNPTGLPQILSRHSLSLHP